MASRRQYGLLQPTLQKRKNARPSGQNPLPFCLIFSRQYSPIMDQLFINIIGLGGVRKNKKVADSNVFDKATGKQNPSILNPINKRQVFGQPFFKCLICTKEFQPLNSFLKSYISLEN